MSSPFRTIINLAISSALLGVFAIGTATASFDDTSGGSSTPSPLKRLVVLDFELTGDLGGSGFEAAHRQRLQMASARLRDELGRSHLYSVVDNAPARALIERLSSEQHLHHCNGCELDIAKQLNAEQVLVPWVYRVSNLVLTMHVAIRDVATGHTIMKKALDFRSDNDTGWTRAIAYLIRDMKKERQRMTSLPAS
ncbi:MAG: DUF3280 domain-containing protein [Gammaproteobacteria bacterium]